MRAFLLAIVIAACGGGSSNSPDGGGGGDDAAASEAVDCPTTRPVATTLSLGFVVDETHFYFASSTVLSRMPVDSTVPEKIADLPGLLESGIAVGTQHLFFVAGGSAWRVLKVGGAPEELGAVSGQVTQIATDGTAVYFSAITNTDIELRRATAPGAGAELLATATADGVAGLASDGIHLYWIPSTHGVVQRVLVGGGPSEMVSDSSSETPANISNFGLAVVGDDVVWSAFYQSLPDGRLFSIPKAGGARRTISHTGLLTGLRVVGDDVFVMVTGTESAVARVPLAGGARTIVGCVEDRVFSLTANTSGVYVAANGDVFEIPL